MYNVSKFEDRNFMACSIPPPANEALADDFQELSRIHFYLGRDSIDHMIEAVEQANVHDIEKGKIQIYFATKEIQEFLRSSWNKLSTFGEDKFDPAIYFNTTFKDLLSHAIETLDKVYKSPTSKKKIEAMTVMMGLAYETIFLNEELNKVGIKTKDISELIEGIKTRYEKIYVLKNNYEAISHLPEVDSYHEKARESVLKQIEEPYGFNSSELARVYECYDGDWGSTLRRIMEEQKDIDNPNYKFHESEAEELKSSFLKQIKGFNRLLKNGVVNYIYSFAASISQETNGQIKKSQISAEDFFNRDLDYYKSSLERKHNLHKDYDREKIEELTKIKDEYIAQKMDDQTFREQYLTILHRQEKNIFQSLDKVKSNLLNVELKNTITFEGDITTGFVIGTTNDGDKVILVHKDPFVNKHEAVYAMVMDKQKYNALVNSGNLIFTEELRETQFDSSSNFWNYGQFLQEISEARVQKFFLGKEFDLIDKTVVSEFEQTKKPKF